MTMTSARVAYLYDLMDAAYDAAAIHDQSRTLGHAPIVDRNFRADHQAKAEWGREVERLKLIHRPDFDDLIYDFRTMAERVNARLKDEFGARFLRVRGALKVNPISCSASSRSPSIRSSVSSTTGPPLPDPARSGPFSSPICDGRFGIPAGRKCLNLYATTQSEVVACRRRYWRFWLRSLTIVARKASGSIWRRWCSTRSWEWWPGANSYRQMHEFIRVHLQRLNGAFGLRLPYSPSYTGLRLIIQGVNPAALEAAFRQHASSISAPTPSDSLPAIAVDGKTLRGGFDAFSDRKAAHMMSALRQADQIVLGHLMVAEKSNEIPAAPELIEALGLKGCVFTLDAEHGQKNRSSA